MELKDLALEGLKALGIGADECGQLGWGGCFHSLPTVYYTVGKDQRHTIRPAPAFTRSNECLPLRSAASRPDNRFKTVAIPYYVVMRPDDTVVAAFPGLTRNPEDLLAFLTRAAGATGASAARAS
jgi:hypothetical protein